MIGAAVGELEFEAEENELSLTVDDMNGEWAIFVPSATGAAGNETAAANGTAAAEEAAATGAAEDATGDAGSAAGNGAGCNSQLCQVLQLIGLQ